MKFLKALEFSESEIVIISVSFSKSKIKLFNSSILMNPVASGSYFRHTFLNFAIFVLNISKPSSSLELVNPFKITATKRFKKIMLTIN